VTFSCSHTKSAQSPIVWFPSETIRYRGVEGFTIPTVWLSRKTDRFVGYENPVTDTISDPFNFEVILGVTFKLESDVLDDEFTGFLFVMVTHAAASINPTTINKANGTISFIEGSVTRRMILI
jgi:hypothetical protein